MRRLLFILTLLLLLLPCVTQAQSTPGTVRFPNNLDDQDSLIRVKDNSRALLTVSMTSGSSQVTVDSTASFPATGVLVVDNEQITYTSKSGTTFTGLGRGAFGTTAASHNINTSVRGGIVAAIPNTQDSAITATQAKVGTGSSTALLNQFLVGTGPGTSVWRPLSSQDVTTALGFAPLHNTSSLSAGLAAFWNLNESSGTRADSVADTNLVSYNAVGQTTGKVSQAASFAASSSQHLSVAANSAVKTGNVDYTITCWVRLGSKSDYMTIIGKDSDSAAPGTPDREYVLRYSPNSDRFEFFAFNTESGLTVVSANSAGSPAVNVWYLLVVQHDAAAHTLKLSVNNNASDTVSVTGSLRATESDFNIGASGDLGGQFYLNGSVDAVGIWKRVLTSQEQGYLWNGGNGQEYPFQATSANVTTDDPRLAAQAVFACTGDNVADDTACMQAVINANVTSNGADLKLLPGKTYVVSGSLTIPRFSRSNDGTNATYATIRISGYGAKIRTSTPGVSIFKSLPTGLSNALDTIYNAIIIEGISFEGSSNSTQKAIQIGASYGMVVRDVRCKDINCVDGSFAIMATADNVIVDRPMNFGILFHTGSGEWPGAGALSPSNGAVVRRSRVYPRAGMTAEYEFLMCNQCALYDSISDSTVDGGSPQYNIYADYQDMSAYTFNFTVENFYSETNNDPTVAVIGLKILGTSRLKNIFRYTNTTPSVLVDASGSPAQTIVLDDWNISNNPATQTKFKTNSTNTVGWDFRNVTNFSLNNSSYWVGGVVPGTSKFRELLRLD